MNARQRPRAFWIRFVRDTEAVSATEYAILLALIIIGAMAAIQGIGERMYNIYTYIDGTMPTGEA